MTRQSITKMVLLLVAIILAVMAVSMPPFGCQARRDSVSGLRTVRMRIGEKTFTLEVADTYSSRQYGLMNRDSLPLDRGMIFVFSREEPLSFWMRNTRIPLDIVYVDSVGKVVSIHRMEPFDEEGVASAGPAQYAIELNAGAAAAAGVKAGDVLAIPREAVSPRR